MENLSPIQKAAEIVGGQAKLARDLSASPAFVNQWVQGVRNVPAKYCANIEVLTDGKVTRKDLRPDDWQLFWPELEKAA
jgi:DNA-binding transcriptional regulator YdaS (Cro superfamily)